MPMTMKNYFILCLIFLTVAAQASPIKEISLTLDDLPFVGDTHDKPYKVKLENERLSKIISVLEKYQIPTTGFVIAGNIEQGQWDLLKKFHNAGFIIANHTYNHLNLNQTAPSAYIANIERANERLAPFLSKEKYFRFPYLAEGKGIRKQIVSAYLAKHHYTIAPVTIDTKDFKFNQMLYAIPYHLRKNKNNLKHIKTQYLNFIWQQTQKAEKKSGSQTTFQGKQILLLHANLINSLFLEDIIQLYKKRGYTFISLKKALLPAHPQPEITNLGVK